MRVRIDSAGTHVFDRETGLNLLADDYHGEPRRWARAPRHVSIALSNACDLRCPYCYAPKFAARLRFDDVVDWAKELDAEGCLGVGFGGGEPTLWPDLAKLCRVLAGETQLAVTMTTHGHWRRATLAHDLRGVVHFIRVSVDGVGPTYERLRGRAYADLVRALERVASIAPFGINVVVNDDTIHDLDAITSLAETAGARELALLPEQPTGISTGISQGTEALLGAWIESKQTKVRLAISEMHSVMGLSLARPFSGVDPLEAQAHVSADASLRANSFARAAVPIEGDGVMAALDRLRYAVGGTK